MEARTLFSLVVLLALSASAAKLQSTGEAIATVTSLDQISAVAKSYQKQFWQLVPPSTEDMFYLHPERVVRVVDWSGKDWPKALLKQMYAEMGATASGAFFPFYKLTVIEDRNGDMVYYNAFNQEVWRTLAPPGYNPYQFAFEHFGVSSLDELTRTDKIWGRSSNVGTSVILLPSIFAESYAEELSVDSNALPLASEPVVAETEPMAMTASTIPTPPGGGGTGGGGGTNTNVNVQVTMTFPLEEGFGSYLVLYGKQNLVYDEWELLEDWIPTYNAESVDWLHAASSNKSCYYYQYFPATDSNMDGIADIVAEREGSAWTNSFCNIDSDLDGMLDAWELKLFGDLTSQSGTTDFDGDGLLNNEELLWLHGNMVVMNSDPSLYDTDGDGLDDGYERQLHTSPLLPDSDGDARDDALELLTLHTDPNNPDIAPPVISLN